MVARRRAKAKAQAKKGAGTNAPPAEKKTKKTSKPPAVTYYPDLPELDDDRDKVKDIDWNDPGTTRLAEELYHRVRDGRGQFTLLDMPTGYGKTAVVVKTLGLIQQERGEHLPFVVAAPVGVVDGKGWHFTIAQWNRVHPDNPLLPMFIDTVDRLANIIHHASTFREFVKQAGKDGIVVMDEAHMYKNPTSKRSKQMQKIPHLTKIGLSATPLTNNHVVDGVSYLVLNRDFANKTRFYNETGLKDRLDQYNQPDIYDRDGRVNPHIWPYYTTFVRQLADVIYTPDVSRMDADMPNVVNHLHQVKPGPTLNHDLLSLGKAYRKRAFDTVTDYRQEIINRIYSDETRLDTLVDILNGDNVVQPLVFYWHVNTRDAIVERLDKEGISYQEMSGEFSIRDIDQSRVDPILIQYQSGGAGVEFKNSNTTVMYENQYSYTQLTQAKGRNVRRGMEGTVNLHFLVCEEHFDRNVFEVVQTRGEVADEVLTKLAMEAGDAGKRWDA